ncbi:MAG TPA: ABC transporter ATP-binding protein [Bacteroidales bacterium]|nr:ABC transporter ATP-binding protein [Bacteroidales bacterium]HRZ48686.1 ABC transporter ATP-binding protein [Bacteroidales bacterium]
MAEKDTVIRLTGVSKMYKLFGSKTDRLKEALHPFKKKYHKPFYALRDINLEVKRGEILGIVGVNGSGKSTLLKLISGIIPATRGSVEVKGRVVPLLELGAGFNPEFTGLENIYFYNSIHGYTRKQTDAILNEILDFAEIGEFIHQPVKTYSSGMKARLAFAVSVNIDPDILILDEVLSVGDELFRRKCYARMEQFFKGGKTILFVSHSVQAINQLCTRSVLLSGGQLILEGPTKLVTAQYERYLYAKKEMMATVREEIVELNKNEALKAAAYAELAAAKDTPTAPPHPTDEPVVTANTPETARQAAKELLKPKAQSLPNLIPKSTVEYRNAEVDIFEMCIKTVDGLKVNVLIPGDRYEYSYKVSFRQNAKNVAFGMMFKTEKGLDICGMNTENIQMLVEQTIAGSIFLVRWSFTCNLLQGTYYTNAGVSEYTAGKHRFLNRIVDVLVFKVREQAQPVNSGMVFMISEKPQIQIIN